MAGKRSTREEGRITPEQFRDRAREWLIRFTGWVSPGRDESLGKELERAYDEGREHERAKRDGY